MSAKQIGRPIVHTEPWAKVTVVLLDQQAGVQLAGGKDFQSTNKVNSDMTGVAYDDKTKVLLLGPPLRITKDNAGQFDY